MDRHMTKKESIFTLVCAVLGVPNVNQLIVMEAVKNTSDITLKVVLFGFWILLWIIELYLINLAIKELFGFDFIKWIQKK